MSDQPTPTSSFPFQKGALFKLPPDVTFFRTSRKPSSPESGPQLKTYIRLVRDGDLLVPRTDGKDSGIMCFAQQAPTGSLFQVVWTWTSPYTFVATSKEGRVRKIRDPRSVGTTLIV